MVSETSLEMEWFLGVYLIVAYAYEVWTYAYHQ